ncbi:MAG: cupin domain-containing protein [Pseudomonadota bacterium]
MARERSEFLSGVVRKDARGGWAALLPEDVPIDMTSLHIVASVPGQVRGNHAHPTREEYLFFFGGRALVVWEEDGRVRRESVGGEGRLLRLAAGVGHAYKNTGDEPAYIMACKGPRLAEGPETVKLEPPLIEEDNG